MQKLTALILSSRDAGEFDRIYTLYTRESGLMRVVGRGVRKPAAKLAGHLEPGTLSEVYVARSRGMGQITSAITISNFESVRNNFEKLEESLKILRFFARNFSEEEKDERIFDLLGDFLGALGNLENRDYREGILTEAFWWKLFDFLGHRPQIMKCMRCDEKLEEKGRSFFSAALGGTLCEKCARHGVIPAEITLNQIKLLRIIL